MRRPLITTATATGMLSVFLIGCDSEPQTLREQAEQARQTVEETREEASELVDEAQEDAVDNLADARQDAKQNINEAKRDAEQMVDRAEEDLEEKLNQLGDQTLPLEDAPKPQPDEAPTVGDVNQ